MWSHPGGEWSGTGFLDESAGLFDPELSGVGLHPVSYTSPAGCQAQAIVEVEAWEQVRISGIDPQYCFKDQDIPVLLNPPGGEFFINGQPSPPVINPARLGSGIWELYYTRGEGNCASSEKTYIKILPAINKRSSSENDSICIGQRTTISIDATGGQGGLVYTWDHGLGFGSSHIVEPTQDSWYLVTVTDGCSDALVDSVFVRVYPRFPMDILNGPPVCFGEKTFVELKLDTADYDIVWQTSPQKKGARLDGDPGIYGVEVQEKSTGCRQRTSVTLPGSAPLAANFGITPNQPCIDIVENSVEILDLSYGYTKGTVDFGDGSPPVDLRSPGALVHQYSDTGVFLIKMRVVNEIGCEDEFERMVCVKNVVRLFIPSIFSPNNDGKHDIFEIFHIGVDILQWAVYDRNGARVFDSKDGMAQWDGTFRGMHVVEGVYVVVIEYFNPDKGKKEIFKGDLTVIR
ncbi:MAG: gliding motility-associated C-terminal domain-containing protein [Saprospiraceae bacterium]|nr:gliding motility-associated C-terminal domain-containing protein [Candidatus Vicinibacter affinis]